MWYILYIILKKPKEVLITVLMEAIKICAQHIFQQKEK